MIPALRDHWPAPGTTNFAGGTQARDGPQGAQNHPSIGAFPWGNQCFF